MHRRLGIIQHKSAAHLPRSASAQPEDVSRTIRRL